MFIFYRDQLSSVSPLTLFLHLYVVDNWKINVIITLNNYVAFSKLKYLFQL